MSGIARRLGIGKDDKEEDPQQQLEEMNERLEEEGANVQEFGEDASPEEKAKKAAKAKEQIKPKGEIAEKKKEEEAEKARELNRAVQADVGGRKVKANVGIRDIHEASKERGQLGNGETLPGTLPAGAPSLNVPDWYRVGWIGVSRSLRGLSATDLEESLTRARDTDLISTFLSEAYYGYMWTDGAAIIAAVVVTYYVARFGGGFSMLLIILVTCGTYYCASSRRTRVRVYDDVRRELARKQMISELESARWINHFLARFWLIYEPVLSATVIESVDAVLAENCPPFLDSLRLTTFTLGTKAPIVESVRTIPDTEEDVIVMDWRVSFTPNDVQDLTVRQSSRKINPRVVLTVRVGKGMAGAGLPILLEDMSFVGCIRIRLKLMSSFPHVQVVDLSFMEAPKFDFALKPIGGSTMGLDVASLPGLSGFIQNQVHSNLGPMMYNPNQFSLNLEELMSGSPLDSTAGVLQVTVWSARDLRSVKFTGAAPNPYVALTLNEDQTLERTRTRLETFQPTFKETKYLLIKDLQGLLTLSVFDDNDKRPATHMGDATFLLQELEKKPDAGQQNMPLMYQNHPRGSIQYSLTYYPVMKPDVAPDGTELPMPETNAGIVRLTLHQAKELVPKVDIKGDMQPKAVLRLNGKQIKETPVTKESIDPIFEDVTEFFVTDRISSTLSVELVDTRKEAKQNPRIALVSVKIEDLIQARKRAQDWFPVQGTVRSRLRMSALWKPIMMAGSINGSNSYRPAIGALKFWIRGATDVKNVEALMGGKSDPYALLRVNNVKIAGTAVRGDNLNPVWNQVLYAPVHSLSEVVRLEVMDYQNSSADRTLGFYDVPVGDLAQESMNNRAWPYESLGRRQHSEQLKQPNGQYKGVVDFEVEFLPAMRIEGSNFLEQNRRMAEEAKARARARAGEGEGDAPPEEEEPETQAGGAVKEEEGDEEEDQQGVSVTPDQLLATPSGVIAFDLIRGDIKKRNVQLEVVFDDAYWPAYTTERRRTDNYHWDEVGEAVIRELDVSRAWFRLRNGPADDHVFAEYVCPTKELLQRCLTQPTEIQLEPVNDRAKPDLDLPSVPSMDMPNMPDMPTDAKQLGAMPGDMVGKGFSAMGKGAGAIGKGAGAVGKGVSSAAGLQQAMAFKVQLSCRYIPMDVQLEPIESVVNQGILSLSILRAEHLLSADRGGKSDPYVIFLSGDEQLARTKTVKRTLHPTFNQDFEQLIIRSRLSDEHVFRVLDWDQVGANDPLGEARVNLAELEPFQEYERTLKLTGEGAGEESKLTVRMMFTPQYAINRTTKTKMLASNLAAGVIGGIGGIGASVGRTGMGAGKGAFNFVTGRGRKKDDGDTSIDSASQRQGGEEASVNDTASVKQRRSRGLHNPFRRHHDAPSVPNQ